MHNVVPVLTMPASAEDCAGAGAEAVGAEAVGADAASADAAGADAAGAAEAAVVATGDDAAAEDDPPEAVGIVVTAVGAGVVVDDVAAVGLPQPLMTAMDTAATTTAKTARWPMELLIVILFPDRLPESTRRGGTRQMRPERDIPTASGVFCGRYRESRLWTPTRVPASGLGLARACQGGQARGQAEDPRAQPYIARNGTGLIRRCGVSGIVGRRRAMTDAGFVG